jgi:hypothetical protein
VASQRFDQSLIVIDEPGALNVISIVKSGRAPVQSPSAHRNDALTSGRQ